MKIMVLWAGAAAVAATTGAFAADAYIEADGTQAIVTDYYYPNPTTKIVADYAYTAVTPTQMAVFGCDGNLVVRHYINGSGGYAFAFRDSSGDWLPVVPSGQFTATTDRRTFVLDGLNKTATLYTGGEISAQRATATATKTANYPMGIFGYCVGTSGATSNPAKLRLYSLDVYENDGIVHCYRPYRSADGARIGLKDLCTGKILLNSRSGASFACGGDISDDPAWDLENVEQPVIVPEEDPVSGDYVITVPVGTWSHEASNTSRRVVKMGGGTLRLANGNTFGDSFVISNGVVEADWAASGLSATHLVLSGPKNISPGVFSPLGSSFTAPVAASGAGTIQFVGYTGIKPVPNGNGLKLNIVRKGSDGRTAIDYRVTYEDPEPVGDNVRIFRAANTSTARPRIASSSGPGPGSGRSSVCHAPRAPPADGERRT